MAGVRAVPHGSARNVTEVPWLDDVTTNEWLEEFARLEQELSPATTLRCLFHTRLVIPGHWVPSGRRYVADPGQVIPVLLKDVKTLLGMTRKQGRVCTGCGSSRWTEPQHYFETSKK